MLLGVQLGLGSLTGKVAGQGGSPAPSAAIIHYPLYGQSLSLGSDPDGASIISSETSNHRMFSAGVRAHIDQLSSGGNQNTPIDPAGLAAFSNLSEQISPFGSAFGETLASGMAAQLSRLSLFSTTGRGAYRINQLDPFAGGFLGDQNHFQNTYASMLYGSIEAAEVGLTYSIGAFPWKHGEADAAALTTRATYKAAITTMRDNLRRYAESAALIDASAVPLVTDQLAFRADSIAAGSGASSTGNGAIAVAVLELHRSNDIVLVGPTYDAEFTAVNDVHFSSSGYREHGERWGLVLETLAGGGTWHPCHITAASRSGTTITLTVHVPSPPLVKDTATFASRSFSDDGFDYSGANITAVSIADTGAGDNTATIEITIDADAGGALRYAYENAAVDFRNLVGGHIRDSASETTINSGRNLWNWLCTDEWVLP
ncbi:MAG: hypothetical protein AAGH38_11380 [Pseudomonadota bacterium]